jgi:hypothetical protein
MEIRFIFQIRNLGVHYDEQYIRRKRVIISSKIRELGDIQITEQSQVDSLLQINDIPVTDKLNKLLCSLGERCRSVGEELLVYFNDFELHSKSWILDGNELYEFINYLREWRFVSGAPIGGDHQRIKITADGWARIEELSSSDPDSSQCFVAMWFHDDTRNVRKAIIEAIEKAGYSPKIIDEDKKVDKIDDAIIKEIRRSKFIVADMTFGKEKGMRGGVYYEAGFAHGLGINVIWTAKKDTELHFDTRQYYCIPWEDDKLEDFIERLADRIEAKMGRGPTSTPDPRSRR